MKSTDEVGKCYSMVDVVLPTLYSQEELPFGSSDIPTLRCLINGGGGGGGGTFINF